MINKEETPCGACDIGTYSELSALNKKAREFGAMSRKERCKNMPKCKNNSHVCFGAKHYHEAIIKIDEYMGEE